MTETSCQTLYRVAIRVLPDAAGQPDVSEVEDYLDRHAGEKGRKWRLVHPDLRVERRDAGDGWLFIMEVTLCLEALNRLKWQDLTSDFLRILSEAPVVD